MTEMTGGYESYVDLEKADKKRPAFEDKFIKNWNRLSDKIKYLGGRLAEDGDKALAKLARIHPDMLVRREYPGSFFDALEKGESLQITFDPEAHGGQAYPNAGVLSHDAYGLRVPFQRGFGQVKPDEGGKGKIITILGFLPHKGMSIRRIPEGGYSHYKDRERSLIRMIEGEVRPEDIRFLLLRIPRTEVPDAFLTSGEEEAGQPFIKRLFLFNSPLSNLQ